MYLQQFQNCFLVLRSAGQSEGGLAVSVFQNRITREVTELGLGMDGAWTRKIRGENREFCLHSANKVTLQVSLL